MEGHPTKLLPKSKPSSEPGLPMTAFQEDPVQQLQTVRIFPKCHSPTTTHSSPGQSSSGHSKLDPLNLCNQTIPASSTDIADTSLQPTHLDQATLPATDFTGPCSTTVSISLLVFYKQTDYFGLACHTSVTFTFSFDILINCFELACHTSVTFTFRICLELVLYRFNLLLLQMPHTPTPELGTSDVSWLRSRQAPWFRSSKVTAEHINWDNGLLQEEAQK